MPVKAHACPLFTLFVLACTALPVSFAGAAEQEKLEIPLPTGILEEILVTGGREAIRSLTGSATFIDEEAIAKFDTTDINALLSRVPGVYIRQEDGFGLRPNIGLRGTTAERSSKITIMEDGILSGPAPYSAPAAYYVPNLGRMSAVEVFKGPAAIKHGPHTVGGAINFVSRPIPTELSRELGLTLGSFGGQKYQAFWGANYDSMGFWLDALRYGSNGFKELDGGGDTGFVRNDLNGKVQFRSNENAGVYQELEFKVGYADEDSNETYLGLTEDDFRENPLRRYRASQLDRFVSDHQLYELLHTADFRNHWKVISRVYHHTYRRSWNKFDGIMFGNNVREVLANPNVLTDQMQLLRGEINSNPLGLQRLDLTDNDRSFAVSGIDIQVQYQQDFGAWAHELEMGVRLHNDWVKRNHKPRGYFMTDGVLVFDGDETRAPKALNKGETDALAMFVRDEITLGNWTVNLGVRYESMQSTFVENAPNLERTQSDTEKVLMPGVGVFYDFTDNLGFLIGINKGFSAKAASASTDVSPEESINYEYGLRYYNQDVQIDLIGFYSDYTNLLGRCRASDPCAGEEFNGGAVDVSGVEFSVQYAPSISANLSLPITLVYTFTDATFATGFQSGFALWGNVEKGDELPYLPKNQLRADIALEGNAWGLALAVKFTDEMRGAAGSGAFREGEDIKALTTFDLSLYYDFSNDITLRLVGENVTNELEVVSRRPFGARPNSPRMLKLNIAYRF